MATWEEHVTRWLSAGVVDEATAQRIRAFEAAESRPAGQRWQVVIALVMGGILFGAGLLLFVAAHWDEVSPAARLSLVVGMLAVLHVGALAASDRFAGMATALHGVGTVACGAAIAMVGQIFNMQEHWPSAVLLWAVCAGVGWWWLRDEFQQICLFLLGPAWLVCEWGYRARFYAGGDVYLARVIAVLAAVYLTAFVHSRRRVVAGVLFAAAGIALGVATGVLAEDGWQAGWGQQSTLPMGLRLGYLALIAAMVAGGWMLERKSVLPVLAVVGMSFALPWLRTKVTENNEFTHQPWTHSEPSVFAYAIVVAAALVLAWWGVGQRSRAVVNYGIAMFAVAVAWFYFSSLMDKLGRSLGLIGLGVMFLAGGWLLERLRRRLMLQMRDQPNEVTA